MQNEERKMPVPRCIVKLEVLLENPEGVFEQLSYSDKEFNPQYLELREGVFGMTNAIGLLSEKLVLDAQQKYKDIYGK